MSIYKNVIVSLRSSVDSQRKERYTNATPAVVTGIGAVLGRNSVLSVKEGA
jgi:hypothetical protein